MQRHLGRSWPPSTKRASVRLLTDAHAYLLRRLGALSQACVVCDEPLKLPGAKPVPCRHDLAEHTTDNQSCACFLLSCGVCLL